MPDERQPILVAENPTAAHAQRRRDPVCVERAIRMLVDPWRFLHGHKLRRCERTLGDGTL